jgi:Protein of unknown function (DUF1682)
MLAAAAAAASLGSLPASVAGDAAAAAAAPTALMLDPRNLSILELILAGLVVVFVVNFIQGFLANAGLIPHLLAVLDPLLEPQFTQLGVDKAGTRIVKDGACDFVYYASGRRYATGLVAAFELQNRQDLFARTMRLFQSTMKDRCVLTIPLAADYAMEPVSLLLVRKKELERLRNSGERTSACLKEVEELAGEVRTLHQLPGGFHVLADHEGVVSAVLSERVLRSLAPVAGALHSLQLTDSGNGWDVYSDGVGPRFVRLVFDLPVGGEAEMRAVLEPMVGVALGLADLSAKVRLAPAARARAVDLRKRRGEAREKLRQRELREELEEKRLEKKRAQEEATDAKNVGDSAKQAKVLERKRKQELKQRMKKATKKV